MDLIVVESPTKAKTLTRFLGKKYRIASTMGHIRDLPKKKLGVNVEKDFAPEYELMVGKELAIKELKKAAKSAKKIFLATDPDREGEAIAYHVAFILKRKEDGLSRIVFHEITPTAIKKALESPGQINHQLVDAQQARRVLDRLVGYKLSPLLWRKIRRGLSAGRVQSVTVRLIVDREREIEKFVAEEYWRVVAELRRHIGGKSPDVPPFLATLTKKNSQPLEIKNEADAKAVVAELEDAGYEVGQVEKKAARQSPPPPFTTSTLQQQAAQRLYFSSKRTMRLAQSLYEKGLITYHRTDSVHLAQEAVAQMRQHISQNYGQKYLPASARIYKTKSKMAQEAHEAIRPTKIGRDPAKMNLSRDDSRLYDLIWRRAVACQMAEAVWDQTKVLVQATSKKNLYHFETEGKMIQFDGWLKLFKLPKEEALPELKKNDQLDLIKINPEQKFTQPPARYTEATLIKALEQRGIGRPSTYAPTVSTIQSRQYVEKKERRFHPTALGTTVNDFLAEYFPQVMDYEFTAQMEDQLDDIAQGKREWQPVIKDFYQPFEEKLAGVTQVAERVKVPTEATDEACPTCKEGTLVIRVGRFGKFLSCSRFPDCKYTAPYAEKIEGAKCGKCGADVVVRKTKKGSRFFGCSRWPKCDWASWRQPKKADRPSPRRL